MTWNARAKPHVCIPYHQRCSDSTISVDVLPSLRLPYQIPSSLLMLLLVALSPLASFFTAAPSADFLC